MTGLGDRPTDAGILVTVILAACALELYPLSGAKLPPLETLHPKLLGQLRQIAASLPHAAKVTVASAIHTQKKDPKGFCKPLGSRSNDC